MLSSLPKILGRGFIVGFVLPSSLFCLYVQYLSFDLPDLSNLGASIDAFKLTPFILTVLLCSVFLMALNRFIIRILEGYGGGNPLRLVLFIRRFVFRWRIKPIFVEYERLKLERKSNPAAESNVRNFRKRLDYATQFYPYEEEWVLPTRFGNAMRSFEVYSSAVYGLDAIAAWPRISFSLSKEVKDQIQDGRAMIDFSANLFVLSLVGLLAYFAKNYDHILDLKTNLPALVPALVPAFGAVYGWFNLPLAARQWGEVVKSTIDISRSRLAKDLGLEFPKTAEKEREMWENVSRMIVFRSGSAYAALNSFRKKPKSDNKATRPATRRPIS